MSLKDNSFSFPVLASQLSRQGIEYLIQMEDNPAMFWSNEFGWTDIESADGFSQEEMESLRLPIDGKWFQVVHNA